MRHIRKFVVCMIATFGITLFIFIPLYDPSLSPWMEVKLSLISLWRAEQICLSKSPIDIIISLTSLPRRVPHIHRTLKTLLLQTRCPKEIHIWIPSLNDRLQEEYILPDWLLEINRTSRIIHVHKIQQDYGPATKLIPLILTHPMAEDQIIITLDDDVLYSEKILQQYECWSYLLPNSALGFSGVKMQTSSAGDFLSRRQGHLIQNPVEVDLLFGTASFLTKPKFFNLTYFSSFWSTAPPSARFEDDWWFSGELERKGTRRWVIPIDHRQIVQLDTLLVMRGDLMNSANADNMHFHNMIQWYKNLTKE